MGKRAVNNAEEKMTIWAHIRRHLFDQLPTMPASVWKERDELFDNQCDEFMESFDPEAPQVDSVVL